MLNAINLRKTYTPKRGVPVKALDGVSLEFGDTGLVFILGKSGSGKSTLLNVLGGLDSIDDGEIEIKGRSCKDFKQGDFDSYRNTFVGFIFQEYNILNEFTIGANIALALQLQGKKATNERVNEILEEVDLVGYGDRKPNELSGGQKQRVAIARALIKDPQIIMADEPTGALDSNTGKQVFDTLKKLAQTKLVMVVSHDREFAEYYGDRVIELADGKVISDTTKYNAPAKNYSDGLNIIDDKIIHIKKGYKLTQSDMKRIAELVDQANSDTVLSIDTRTNESIKQIAMFDESGKASFKDTSSDDVKTKSYSSADSKFIKAKFPFRHALKMGASSLKVKPFRLFITILLSCVAFVLFGVVDTAAAYNKHTTATDSIIEQGIENAVFTQLKLQDTGYYIYREEIMFNDAEIEALANRAGIDLIGIAYLDQSISVSNYFISNASISYYSFYQPSINYYYTATNEGMEDLGCTVYGRLPSAANEIVLPMYFYNQFKKSGFEYKNGDISEEIAATDLNYSTGNDPNSIIGKHMDLPTTSYVNGQLTIVGVVDTNLSTEGYDFFLSDTIQDNNVDYMQFQNMQSYLKNSLHTAIIVSPTFHDTYYSKDNALPSYVHMPVGYSYIMMSGNSREYSTEIGGYASSSALSNVDYLTVLTGQNEGGVYLPMSMMTDLVDYDRFNTSTIDIEVEIPNDPIGNTYPHSFSTPWDYYENGVGIEALYQYVNSLSAAQLNSIYESDEYKFAYNSFSVYPDIDVSADQKKRGLVFLMSIPKLPSQVENMWDVAVDNELYYNSTDTHKSGRGIIEKAKCEYLLDNNFVNIKSANFSIDNHAGIAKSIDVIGFYVEPESFESANSYKGCIVFGDQVVDFFGSSNRKEGIYSRAIGVMPKTVSDVRKLVDINYEEVLYEETQQFAYQLNNPVMSSLDFADSIISVLSDVMLYVSIALALFAALLLWNYISVSVSSKRREIGILRAVGAKSVDVFSIFFLESLIISLISFVISAVGCGITVFYLNRIIVEQMSIGLSIFSYSIRQILLIMAISILVAFLGSFIPSYSISKKKPIDAIADR